MKEKEIVNDTIRDFLENDYFEAEYWKFCFINTLRNKVKDYFKDNEEELKPFLEEAFEKYKERAHDLKEIYELLS